METFHKFAYVTFLCAVFCFAWSTQDKLRVNIPATRVLELKQQADKCEQETGIPASHLKKIIEKTLPNDQPNNDFFFCVAAGSGLVEKDGHFNVDNMSTLQAVDGTPEEYSNALKECNKIDKSTATETLLAAADCIHKTYQFVPVAKQ